RLDEYVTGSDERVGRGAEAHEDDRVRDPQASGLLPERPARRTLAHEHEARGGVGASHRGPGVAEEAVALYRLQLSDRHDLGAGGVAQGAVTAGEYPGARGVRDMDQSRRREAGVQLLREGGPGVDEDAVGQTMAEARHVPPERREGRIVGAPLRHDDPMNARQAPDEGREQVSQEQERMDDVGPEAAHLAPEPQDDAHVRPTTPMEGGHREAGPPRRAREVVGLAAA